MNYSYGIPLKYGGTLLKEMNEDIEKVVRMHEKMSSPLHAHSIPQETRDAQRTLVTQMKEESPEYVHAVFDSQVLSREHLTETGFGLGGITRINGKSVVLIDSSIAQLSPEKCTSYRGWKRKNLKKGRTTSPAEWFKAVAAHEYGHLLDMKTTSASLSGYYCRNLGEQSDNSESEAFAFWFGDAISGFDTPILDVFPEYVSLGNDVQRMTHLYQILRKHERKEGIRKTIDDWAEILVSERKKESSGKKNSPESLRQTYAL